jgi:hypothetical protein
LFSDATAAASCSASGADRLVIDVPNRRRLSSSSCGRAGVLGEGDFRLLPAPGHPDDRVQPLDAALRHDVENRVGRALSGEANRAPLQVESAAGKVVAAADQVRPAGDPRLGHRSADRKVRAPFAVDAEPGDDQPVVGLEAELEPPRLGPAGGGKVLFRPVELADRQPRHLRRRGCAAKLEAAADQAEIARE